MEINSDFSDLLSLLGRHRVRYLIVGGWAVVYHAEPRGVGVNLIGKRDLIRNKRASGRPQDLLDLETLTGRER